MKHRRVACVHIPRFAVEAERRRRHDIASRLLLIGEATVLDCSLGAETSGVRRGMRMSEAIGLCHKAVVLPPDAPYYEKLFGEVLDFLETMSLVVEGADLGTAWLSLDGLPAEPQEFAEGLISLLHRRCAPSGARPGGFMPSVGVAGGKFAARVAAVTSRPGVAKTVPPGGEAEFLAPLPVDHLPAGDAMRWRMALLGLAKIGDVAEMELGPFQAQFGQEGKRCWELARGVDEEPLSPRLREEAIVRRLQMPAPAVALDAILAGLERLLLSSYGGPERGGRWVRKAIVRGALDGGGTWELPVTFREALADPRDAWFAVKAAVTRRPPERPVEELEVELVGLTGESGKQASMFEAKGRQWRQVAEAARQLGARPDAPGIGKVMEVEPWSRIPERRAAIVPMPHHPPPPQEQ
jgi:nucleotidyltransferase/DNA polymerase involved in DNA repair